MKHANILITVQSIIVAGLLVWTQLWGHAYDVYTSYSPPDPIWHISLILGILYIAILASMISIVLTFIILVKVNGKWLTRFIITLSGYSWTCIAVLILISAVPLFDAAWFGDTQWHPSALVLRLNPAAGVLGFVVGSIVSLLLLLLYVSPKLEKYLLSTDNQEKVE